MMKTPGSLPGSLLCMRAWNKDIWAQAAQPAGVSLTQYIITAVEAQIKQEPEH